MFIFLWELFIPYNKYWGIKCWCHYKAWKRYSRSGKKSKMLQTDFSAKFRLFYLQSSVLKSTESSLKILQVLPENIRLMWLECMMSTLFITIEKNTFQNPLFNNYVAIYDIETQSCLSFSSTPIQAIYNSFSALCLFQWRCVCGWSRDAF